MLIFFCHIIAAKIIGTEFSLNKITIGEMNKYLILRNGEQTGPFTLEQLRFLNLQANDIVWVQGQSDKWTSVGEIEELKEFLQNNGGVGVENNRNTGTLPIEGQVVNPSPSKTNPAKFYKPALVASVLAIVLLAGLLIKKSFEPEVVEIKDVSLNPPAGEATTNAANFQNALSKEFIPVEKKPKKLKPKELKKMVSVHASKYEVKILGGIKDLDLTVQNFSDHFLDEVIVKVEYLKPKGEVINSEMITISGVKAGESKTIEVPPSSRGVKVNYSIEDIVSKEYKAILEEL